MKESVFWRLHAKSIEEGIRRPYLCEALKAVAVEIPNILLACARLRAEMFEARKDVLSFGSHLDNCAHRLNPGKPCDCGFAEVIDRAMGLTPTEPA